MPELPEMENAKRYLDATSLHQEIAKVTVLDKRVLDDATPQKLTARLKGRAFDRVERLGKQLFLVLDGGGCLTIHFGMTGRFAYYEEEPPRRDHVRFDFKEGYHLSFIDPRLFGAVGYDDTIEASRERLSLGPDIMALTRADFVELMGRRRGQAKSALMDQHFVAGLGNLYSDEALYQAGIHPKAQVDDMSAKALGRLYDRIKAVLEGAIEAGAGREGYRDRVPGTWLLSAREDGADCPGGKGTVRKITAAGRSSYYCTACQPPP